MCAEKINPKHFFSTPFIDDFGTKADTKLILVITRINSLHY
jgi:hypothetical protein